MLTPLFETRLVDKINDQRTSYGADDKRSIVTTKDLYLDSNYLDCNKMIF